MSDAVLLCTVGGSHQPILKAIESVSPEYVCFFCTQDDPKTGDRGSEKQVTGKGNCIKASPKNEKPTLPNIPKQAELENGGFDPYIVPADDFDGAVSKMRAALVGLREKYPDRRIVADYTGGTKTMSAALVCLALEFDDIDLQLVTGPRNNLRAVTYGQVHQASVRASRLRKEAVACLDSWRWFAYHEAAEGLRNINRRADDPIAKRLQFAQRLSDALALWDRFNHADAWDSIKPMCRAVMQQYSSLTPSLILLTSDGPKREPARLFDLWLNAERRAAQGRFDDAIARWYRLMEWTAQWQIKVCLGAETKDFPKDQLPAHVTIDPDQDGKIKVPLFKAWEIAQAKIGGACGEFFGANKSTLRDLLQLRNHSMLAHGFRAASKAEWERVQEWTLAHFMPMLTDLAKQAGLGQVPEQLPNEPPALD